MSACSYDRKRAGALLQAKRMEEGFTQEKLAELVGCSTGTIAAIEGGTVGMSIESLLMLCRLLKITPNEVLLGTEPDEAAWICHALTSLTPEQRKVAINIVSPYIASITETIAK